MMQMMVVMRSNGIASRLKFVALHEIKSEMMLEVGGTRQIMMQMMEMMQRMLVMQNAEGIGTLTQPEKTHDANDANAGDAE